MGLASWFDNNIHQIFFRYGLICHKYRYILLVSSILATVLSAVGFVWIEEQTTKDPEYVFSPEGAPWRKERAILSEYWPLNEQKFWPGKSYDLKGFVDVIVAGKVEDPAYGRPNILAPRYLDEVARINDFIIQNLTVPVDIEGKHYEAAYTDLCMSFEWKCFMNEHLTLLMPRSKWGNFSGPIAEFAHDVILKEVNVTYPIGWRGTEPIYFGALVGAPHLKDEEGHFDYAKAVRLSFNTREEKVGNISRIWRHRLTEYLTSKKSPPSSLLDIGMYHNESLPEGLQDVADALAPKFAGICAILITFCYAVSIVLVRHTNGTLAIDWVRSKPIVALAGIVCPLMAIITSFGLMLWTGAYYNAIVNVSPFLIVAIGIDDLFIMVSAWHRTNPELSPARRLAETLQEAAVAITITSVTDITTFGIGTFTPLPGVRMFCTYTCLQCVFTYVYQLTFFSAVLACAAEMEDKGTHSLLFVKAMEPAKATKTWQLHLLAGSISRKATFRKKVSIKLNTDENDGTSNTWIGKLSEAFRKLETKLEHHESDMEGIRKDETMINQLFREVIGPFILEKTTQSCAFIIFCIYLGLAILGCCQIREGLSPKFLVRESFYLANFYTLIDETFWNEGLQMQVVVSNVPDLSDPAERAEFASLVRAFENTQYTMKHNATMLWLDAYEKYLQEQKEDFHIPKPKNKSEWYRRCKEWLFVAGGRRLWELDMVWKEDDDEPVLKAFRFQVGLRHYNSPVDHTNSCKLMRSIAAQFAKFNVTTFHEYYPFADQYLELKPSLTRNFVLGLLSMFIATVVMIPDWRAALAVVLAIGSINIGVLGYMTFWGVNLDSVSVITVIMCVGFAVDLSAHIAYAYSQAYGTAHQRAVESLETLGWPVFLGASSTLLGISVLTLVDSYIVLIFFKTVFLVISFSMLHGLLFLPILLMFFIPHERKRIGLKSLHPSVNAMENEIEFPPKSSSRSSTSSRNNSEDLSVRQNEEEKKQRELDDDKLSKRSRASSLSSLRQTLETIDEAETDTEHSPAGSRRSSKSDPAPPNASQV